MTSKRRGEPDVTQPGAAVREEKFRGVGGLNIFFRSWSAGGPARGVVVISHGLNAHSGHYEWVAQQFTTKGARRLRAGSSRPRPLRGRALLRQEARGLRQDLATFIDMAKSREPGLPVFLLGHSAGGVISCGYTLDHQDEIAGLICESFAYQVPAPDIALAIAQGAQPRGAARARVQAQERGLLARPGGRGGAERRPADCQRVAADADGRRAGARR